MGLKTFLINMKYLLEYNLKEISLNNNISNIDEYRDYEAKLYENNIPLVYYPKIISIEDTMKEMIETNKSVARFGDGEFTILEKKDISFQKHDYRLEERLREILVSKDENIAIGINYTFFNELNSNYTLPLTAFIKNFIRSARRSYLKHIDFNKIYYSSEFTHLYSLFVNYDFVKYFNDIKKIWNKKDIIIVGGETIFDNIDYNIFDNANSFNHFKAPSKNAFDNYESILNTIINTIPKNTLIIIILGPTATVLAYDLYKAGYRALDFGHIAKSYDYFMKQVEVNIENTSMFFKPD